MQALFLTESDVTKLISMPLAIEAVRAAHRALSEASAIDIPRARTRTPKTALHILQGALPTEDAIGMKAYTSNRSGVRFMVYVYSASTGALRVAIEANLLGMMRTAAASALATDLLARKNASVLGMFGSGWQAEGHLAGIAAVRSLKAVKVSARNPEKLAAFCQKMSAQLGILVVPTLPEDTVKESDIVSAITSSATPLFDAAWAKEGAHINGAGANALIRQELPEALVRKARLIVVDSKETALKEAGDLLPALEKGHLTERSLVELGDLVIGSHKGRQTEEEITLFESQGMAIQDIALAVRLEALARAQGLGQALPFGA